MTTDMNSRIEYGDFQTPSALSDAVCQLLINKDLEPQSVIEPTFGKGSFIISTLTHFKSLKKIYGLEINKNYVDITRDRLSDISTSTDISLEVGDFFLKEWKKMIDRMPDPLLIIGNPPWVTNSELSSIQSDNLPQKSNFKNLVGIDAITGRSNFDISEWMIIRLIQESLRKDIHFSMLCKTTVARNVLEYFWEINFPISTSEMYIIDTDKYFSASVDACLLYIKIGEKNKYSCRVYSDLFNPKVINNFGYRDGLIVADVTKYDQTKHLGGETVLTWRSGIKHDCSKVMELTELNGFMKNKLGETVSLEDDYLYPMLKSSDIANSSFPAPSKWMLVTQKYPGEDTSKIKEKAPLTWNYLQRHSQHLDDRKSSIYIDKPRFSIFGVGNYSFLPWKVAISGLYKKIQFSLVSPYKGKPTVLDDTCYFLSFNSESQARLIYKLLNSDLAKEFYSSFIFWDSKRPITIKVLKRLDISKLAIELDKGSKFRELIQSDHYKQSKSPQMTLFDQTTES